MNLRRMLKSNALHALSGAWWRAIGVVMLTALPIVVLNTVEQIVRMIGNIPMFLDLNATPQYALDDRISLRIISLVLSVMVSVLIFLISAPLSQGASRWYYRRTEADNDAVSEIFHYFETMKDYGKSILLHVIIGFRMFLWTMLLTFPPIALGVFFTIYAYSGNGMEVMSSVILLILLLLAVWIIIAGALIIFARLRYFPACYLLTENPNEKAGAIIKNGVKLMRGYKGGVFMFELSFLPWFVPGILGSIMFFLRLNEDFSVTGIVAILLMMLQLVLMFFILPYRDTSRAMYARYLIQLSKTGGYEENETREYSTADLEDELGGADLQDAIGMTKENINSDSKGNSEADV